MLMSNVWGWHSSPSYPISPFGDAFFLGNWGWGFGEMGISGEMPISTGALAKIRELSSRSTLLNHGPTATQLNKAQHKIINKLTNVE